MLRRPYTLEPEKCVPAKARRTFNVTRASTEERKVFQAEPESEQLETVPALDVAAPSQRERLKWEVVPETEEDTLSQPLEVRPPNTGGDRAQYTLTQETDPPVNGEALSVEPLPPVEVLANVAGPCCPAIQGPLAFASFTNGSPQ